MKVHWTDDPSLTPLAAPHHHSSSHDRFGIRNLHFRKLLYFLAPLIWLFSQLVSCRACAKPNVSMILIALELVFTFGLDPMKPAR